MAVQEEHHRLFDPPLPVPKQVAIERLGMGIVDKLFIRFRPESATTDSSAAQESLPGRNVLSHQLLWKVMGLEVATGLLRYVCRAGNSPCLHDLRL